MERFFLRLFLAFLKENLYKNIYKIVKNLNRVRPFSFSNDNIQIKTQLQVLKDFVYYMKTFK